MVQPQAQPSGLLVIDKPQGVTSHDLVAAVRAGLHTKKVGHAGTLDPMATGVLVIGFGNATRLLNYIVDHDKTYEATIRLGRATTTDDADGELIALSSTSPSESSAFPLAQFSNDWREFCNAVTDHASTADTIAAWRERIERTIAEQLTGAIEQVPNTFSAIKINGQRAYDLARDGKDVALKARPVTIHSFDVLDMRAGLTDTARTNGPLINNTNASAATSPTSLTPVIDLDVRVSCSAGTYIRALARDLGTILGCGGYLTRLRRTRVGRFDLDTADIASRVVTAHVESCTFTNRDGQLVTRNRAVLDQAGDELTSRAMTMVDAVRTAMSTLAITAEDAANLRFGRRIAYDVHEPTAAYVPACGDVAAIVDRAKRGEAKPIVVFAAD
ncbi:pseudouridine synthase [Bifidobacterium hapali]|uniref:tRNA pseudouridine synthase B n=1 Tax=Bifidobacterium hapali TaxID=1630172 RepID=A0A261FWX6_9BIFI|nr:tRNA pseudouridine(55) synthase TruB [Bifidobacterium hapali]OZG63690.1 pseudouridine synthase [Bifidobacterium hapali]